MTDASEPIGLNRQQLLRGLWHPSTWLLLAANIVPIWGVLQWGWDVFILLIVYWLETAVIGFWSIARIAIAPAGSMGPLLVNGQPVDSRADLILFFILHASGFMGVHLVFLWGLFAGPWSDAIHGPSDFVNKLVIATGLWIPLSVLFIVRGASFLFHALKPEFIEKIERSLSLPVSKPPAVGDLNSIIGTFYTRVVVMHVTIILGAFTAQFFGSIAPLIIMILLKTAVDIAMHLTLDFGQMQKSAQLSSCRAEN